MNTEQRRDLRLAIIAAGFDRVWYTTDIAGNGAYREIWDDHKKDRTFDRHSTTIDISWGEKEKD